MGVQSLLNISGLKKEPQTPHTHTYTQWLHLSPLHICAIAHHWFTEHIWVQQWWLKQADSFKAEEELESHYRYNWISFQPCEWKKDLSPPWRKWSQKIQSLYLLRCIEGECLCILCTDAFHTVRLRVCECVVQCAVWVCLLHISMHKIPRHTHTHSRSQVSNESSERERNGFPWCSSKRSIREGQIEDSKMQDRRETTASEMPLHSQK